MSLKRQTPQVLQLGSPGGQLIIFAECKSLIKKNKQTNKHLKTALPRPQFVDYLFFLYHVYGHPSHGAIDKNNFLRQKTNKQTNINKTTTTRNCVI